MINGVPRRDRRTDDDVADQLGDLDGGRLARTGAPGVGNPSGGIRFAVDGEAQDVGRAILTHELLVERRDGHLIGEDQRNLREATDALVNQGAVGERHPALEVDDAVALLIGGVDINAHEGICS